MVELISATLSFLNDDAISAPSVVNESKDKQATSRHFQRSFYPNENKIWDKKYWFPLCWFTAEGAVQLTLNAYVFDS